nr:retrovirus-related Pol polyprotein from transposon TNT 1-94 [Tanacetum cinerariifolium]
MLLIDLLGLTSPFGNGRISCRRLGCCGLGHSQGQGMPLTTPSIGFMRPFGCLVTILNTLDPLGKFQGKLHEGFLVGYSVCSKAFRVFNSRTRVIQETLHVNFLENKPNVAGQTTTGKKISNPFMAGSLLLTTFIHIDDVTRLQALVDRKKVVIMEAAIRGILRLDDAEGSMSAKRTLWNEFSSAMASAVICLSTEDETPLFEGMLVARVIEEEGDAEEQVQDVIDDAATQGADTAVQGDDVQEPSIPSPTPPTPPHNHLKIFHQHLSIETEKVGSSQRIDTSDNIIMEDASNQGRMIDDLDKDDAVALMDDKEEENKEEKVKDDQVQGRQAEIYKIDMDHVSKVLSMQEEEPAKVQEVVDVVTTDKLITEVVTAASETVTAASTTISADEPQVLAAATTTAAPIRVAAASARRRKGVVTRDPKAESTIIPANTKSKDEGKGIMVEEPKPLKKKQQVEMDEEYSRKLHEELNKYICYEEKAQTEAQAQKNMIMYLKNVAGFRLDYFKGMSYDDIRPIFEAKFNSNIEFLLKTKEQLEEEENRAIQSINETLAQKAAKRRKLNEEVKDLKRHLEIVPDEDDDVYTKATPLARKIDKLKSRRIKGLPMVKRRLRAGSYWNHVSHVKDNFAAASTRRRKGVVIKDPEEESTTIIPADAKSKDKCKRIMVEEPKPLKKKQQVEMDEEYAKKLHEELNKDIDWDVAIEHVKQKAKEDPGVQRYQGMSYGDIRPIFEAKFNSNNEFLLKTKEQLEEEVNREIQSINETPVQKAAKMRKLNKEVKDLKRHLEIVPDEDDDVYREATLLAKKMDKLMSKRIKGLPMVKRRLRAGSCWNHVYCQAKVGAVGLVLLKEELMLLSQVNTVNVILMMSRQKLRLSKTSAAAGTLMKK